MLLAGKTSSFSWFLTNPAGRIMRRSTGQRFTSRAKRPALRNCYAGPPDTMKRDAIPEFTNTKLSTVRETVRERFRAAVEIHQIEGEVRIDPSDRELTLCPGLYWRSEGRAQFVLF